MRWLREDKRGHQAKPMRIMTIPYEIKRVGLFSAVKAGFLIGAIGGFLLGLVGALFGLMALDSIAQMGVDPDSFAEVFEFVSAGMLLFFPLTTAFGGAVAGIIGGFLGAAIYNTGARFWGGLEVELTDPGQAPSRQTTAARRPPSETEPTSAAPLPLGAIVPPKPAPKYPETSSQKPPSTPPLFE
jgi:hypothetical protein